MTEKSLTDIRYIRQLVNVLEESSVGKLHISDGTTTVSLSKEKVGKAVVAPIAATPVSTTDPETIVAPPTTAADEETGATVSSPMVGTYYSSPAPGAAAFVIVGSQVNAGDTLCIIEAMKMMNHIKADVSGAIKQLPLKDGDPVEFGQVLAIIA